MDRSLKPEQRTILVVDDLPANIGKLFALLADHYKVRTALSGRKAIEMCLAEPPDLILLDCMMPGMTGYEVVEELKKYPETSTIPVVFVTSLESEEDEAKGLRMGALDYIVKPFRPAIVLARIQNHLRLKEYGDLLKEQSRLDQLTGVANRRAFDDDLYKEFRRAVRLKHPLSVIMLDVDFFKDYNDHYGHLAGDDCLRAVARSIVPSLRTSDLVARYGGEEFVCLLPHTDELGAREVAEKLRRGVEELDIAHLGSSVSSRVTCSVGVASMKPTEADDATHLVTAADEALYRAKAAGRNRISR